MDIICLTSLNEGTPVSLIEAQASGKPIVSETGGIENIVLENKTALLSKNDLYDFSNKLLDLVNDSEKRNLLSKYGIEKSKDFHYSRLIDEIKKLYEQLL